MAIGMVMPMQVIVCCIVTLRYIIPVHKRVVAVIRDFSFPKNIWSEIIVQIEVKNEDFHIWRL